MPTFTWVPIYQELASRLVNWQDRTTELISFLERLREKGLKITPLTDKDANGNRFLIREIDPFTFFGVFNRRIRDSERLSILMEMKVFFGLQSVLPEDFSGIPVLNPMNSWFIACQRERGADDVAKLWSIFKLALADAPLQNPEFSTALDGALRLSQTNVKLTMGLFWIRPNTFLSLDHTNREYFKIELPSQGLTSNFYLETLSLISRKGKSFPELSYDAWISANGAKASNDQLSPVQAAITTQINYWLVGAYWEDRDPRDQTERFLSEGIWQNGYDDRYLDEVRSMRVGDKIGIKASSTQQYDLPFDAGGRTVSRNIIKAIGTVVANRNDGKVVEVEWDEGFSEKNWYFYTYRPTVWHLRFDNDYKNKEYAERLRDFVWYGKPQDYEWFTRRWFGDSGGPDLIEEEEIVRTAYGIEDVLASGVFLSKEEVNDIINRITEKKAVIIQGPPGVGKTFIARNLAFAVMGEKDPRRIEMVQFHQSYSYDDFVRGYRPAAGQPGLFGLQDGVFYRFCQKATNDPDREYLFIIDEINRGNLSQIFGELLMLIEHDKRGKEFSVQLVYHKDGEPTFYIPSNLYIIGLMNVADRSLALVDYALRRRFAFISLKPQYENPMFSAWLGNRSMNPDLVKLIVERLSALNGIIREDPLLGENYEIGHSFFCPKGDDFSKLDRKWYDSITRTEIVPLLREYWFDNVPKFREMEKALLLQ